MPSVPHLLQRRQFLRRSVHMAMAGATLTGLPALAAVPGARSLAFDHTHTGERIELVYALGDQYLPAALTSLNLFLRDHYSGDVGVIDPLLFDRLHQVQRALGSAQAFQVISGYRAPDTNARLRQTRAGGVANQHLHKEGKANDIRLPDVALADLHSAALEMRAGGVGFYPREQFVHIDTGRIRHW